jgi:hypothetical protein
MPFVQLTFDTFMQREESAGLKDRKIHISAVG